MSIGTTAIELRDFKKKKKNMDKMGKTFLGITGYGSTLYIDGSLYSPHTLGKLSSYFHFQVNLTFNNFMALNM